MTTTRAKKRPLLHRQASESSPSSSSSSSMTEEVTNVPNTTRKMSNNHNNNSNNSKEETDKSSSSSFEEEEEEEEPMDYDKLRSMEDLPSDDSVSVSSSSSDDDDNSSQEESMSDDDDDNDKDNDNDDKNPVESMSLAQRLSHWSSSNSEDAIMKRTKRNRARKAEALKRAKQALSNNNKRGKPTTTTKAFRQEEEEEEEEKDTDNDDVEDGSGSEDGADAETEGRRNNSDPTFVVDYEDVLDPKEVGMVNDVGFSAYTYSVFNDTMLVAIIQETDATGIFNLGVRVSLFDATDPVKPQELQKFSVGSSLFSSIGAEGLLDYKASRWVELGEAVGLVIFPVSALHLLDRSQTFHGFFVLEVSPTEIRQRSSITHVEGKAAFDCYNPWRLSTRSLLFNGSLTTLKGHSVLSTDLVMGELRWELKMIQAGSVFDCTPWF